jgi:mono/diheme cytochrome c family protein
MAANRARGVQLVGVQLLAPPPLAGRGPGNSALSAARYAAVQRGATAYAETCAACHGESGRGTPVSLGSAEIVAPALAGSPRVGGHRDYVIRTLLHGLTGPIDGRTYAGGIMIPHGQHDDAWIAAVTSYLRTSLTNQASYVTPEQVARVRAATADRKTPWTYPELIAAVPVRIPPLASWKATASHASENAGKALTTAGWSTTVPQAAGMWWQVELPETVTLAELEFVSRQPRAEPDAPPPPVEFPRGYRVQLSLDGATWGAPVAEGASTGGSTTIPFAPTRARFVRVTQTASPDAAPPWSMQELRLYVLPTPDSRTAR